MKGRSNKTLEVPNAVRRSILLVDTDPCILALLKAMLEGQGYRVLLASCSETAIRIVTHSRLRINYLMTNVLDSQAPDLAARIQNLRPEMEMLFMSVIKERDAIRVKMPDSVSAPQHRPAHRERTVPEEITARPKTRAAAAGLN
jgi:DNA-binding NtrC family response regulator